MGGQYHEVVHLQQTSATKIQEYPSEVAQAAVNFILASRERLKMSKKETCNLVTYSLAKGLKKFGGRAFDSAYGEMEQLHDRDCFKPIDMRTKELTAMGFKQGLVDPCLFFRNGIVLVIYIDDCLIFTPEKQRADNFIKELEKRFTIEEEGDITNYLGINITTPDADTIQMVQPAMINRIIDTLGLKDDRQHDTPADPNVKLHKDKDGLPRIVFA